MGRKSRLFKEMTDGDVMAQIVSDAGLTAGTIGATTLRHLQLVQYCCSDWDFLLARAEANGMVVIVEGGSVNVAPPAVTGNAALDVAYGVSIIAFEAEVDARHQYSEVKAMAWSPKDQALLTGAAGPAVLNAQGNLDSSTLARVLGLGTYELRSDTAMSAQALAGWAAAQQIKSGLARLRGRMKFQGSALAQAGGLITLRGVGARLSGDVYVSKLTHHVMDGSWVTEVEFGTPAESFTERTHVTAPAGAGLLLGIEGLHIGVVTKLDGDPDGEHRIQVKVPVIGDEPVWARLLQVHASSAFGAFFVPEVGDEVVIGYFNRDPQHPVVLGSLYSSKHAAAYPLTGENDTKALVARCGSRLEFDERDKVITVTTSGDNRIVISDKDKSVTLKDQNGNTVVLSEAGIKLDSQKDIVLSAKGKVTLDSVGEVAVSSKADIKLTGLNVGCTAQVGFTGRGAASAELSADGQTTVKGAMVMIN